MHRKQQNTKLIHASKLKRRKFIKNSLFLGSVGAFFNSYTPSFAGIYRTSCLKKKKLNPVLKGNWWLIGPPPPVSAEIPSGIGEDPGFESVDHHAFQGNDGLWHLWGCVRETGLGRILYHWKAKRLTDSPWEITGEFIRCDTNVGECIDAWDGKEWIQSPFFIKDNSKYYMFYGGSWTGRNNQGVPVSGAAGIFKAFASEGQICLMTSDDGLYWERYLHKDGFSRLFIGPGGSRDPCVIKVDGLWYMYYCGSYGDKDHFYSQAELERFGTGISPYKKGAIFLRTSTDLIHWSDYSVVHHDPTFGVSSLRHECPFVAYRDGYFYLFKTTNYRAAITHVYRSEDPGNFGTNAESAQKMYVGIFPVAAPEIYEFEGKEYVSSNHDPRLGTQISQMKWEPI